MKKTLLTYTFLLVASPVFSQAPNSWTQKADFGGGPRGYSNSFSIGSKGYLGGNGQNATDFKKDFWEYDPDSDTWTQKADFTGPDNEGVGAFSIGDKGYIGPGYNGGKGLWEYDPDANSWTQKANFGGHGQYGVTGFSIGTKGYMGLGSGINNAYFKDFWEYDPGNDTWTQKADFGGEARQFAVGFGIGSKGYVGTGVEGVYPGNYFNDFWEYDPDANHWTQKANFGGTPRCAAVGFNIGSKGYIGTGSFFDGTGYLYKDFWEYDPIYDSWIQKSDMSGGARSTATGFSIGNKGYLGTGHKLPDIYLNDFWEYTSECNGGSTVYSDIDGDGYGDVVNSLFVADCVAPSGYVYDDTDCNDEYPTIYPGGLEIINCIDDNCNGAVDDVFANVWIQIANFSGTGRYGATGFSIGSRGYIGTGYDGGNKKDFWEYDPSLNTWTQKADFGGTARQNAVGFSIDSKGYIGTGNDGVNTKDFWEYDPATNAWTQKANFGGTAREQAAGFSNNGKGYIGTGYDGANKKDFWEYNSATNTWTQKADFGGTARKSATGFSMGGKGYIGTGNDGSIIILNKNDFWEYNPITNTWTQKANFGGAARRQAVGFSANGKGYLGTGRGMSTYNDFWEYDPALNIWAQKTGFGGTARYSAVGFSIEDKGYIGTGNDNTNKNDFWIYIPTPESPVCPLPLSLTISNITNEEATVSWIGNACAYSYRVRKRSVGTPDWIYSMVIAPITSQTLSNNLPSTTYEVQVQTYCDSLQTDSSGYTASVNFTSASDGVIDCSIPEGLLASNITSTSAQLNWDAAAGALSYKIRYKVKNSETWTIVKPTTNKWSLTGLTEGTWYVWKVKSVCATDSIFVSDFSPKEIFTTAPLKMGDAPSMENSMEIYPNPSSGEATIQFNLLQSSFVTVKIFDVNGREMHALVNQTLEAGDHSFSINTAHFAKGVYVVRMISEEQMINQKLVVE